ncbi:tRNA (uracil-O(2)-)-methyltransferase [Podosphaera aphanis]|nr:tRNA (uracil-O(2)-)-methyltransferase [Podosphaera aphanis]
MEGTAPEVSFDAYARLKQEAGEEWSPICLYQCTFPPDIFAGVMRNLIRNPNLNSNHLFRADVQLDQAFGAETAMAGRVVTFHDFVPTQVTVCTLIPRNSLVDAPLDQTCVFYDKRPRACTDEVVSLVTYLPHFAAAADAPFYYPAVAGIAFLHQYSPAAQAGKISLYYSFFTAAPRSLKLERVAQHLLGVVYKHGQGTLNGYVKRVNHDVILPQAKVQNTYSRLKAKYARKLIQEWAESTDPVKHVFEDLGIAAFLMELWGELYPAKEFPGFVDIGCGNGLLVHILNEEGYSGWGFDARKRKSWPQYSKSDGENLKELVLVPSIINLEYESQLQSTIPSKETISSRDTNVEPLEYIQEIRGASPRNTNTHVHDGLFPNSPFIISNHADELTPWTPLLATLSRSHFMMIPCCSHDFSGSRFRAPSVQQKAAPRSAYASLVAWVSQISHDCGWKVEKEMLRIPSTRNTALIGRARTQPYEDIHLGKILAAYGGATGWEDNVTKLTRGLARNH